MLKIILAGPVEGGQGDDVIIMTIFCTSFRHH